MPRSADSTTAVDPATVSLAIGSIAIAAGDSLVAPVTVTVNGVARAPKPGEISLSSSDTAVIVIAPNGALLAVGDGTASVTASWVATTGITASQSVVVSSEHLIAVSVTVPSTLAPGDTAAILVTGQVHGGRSIAHPTSVTVTSRNPAVVTTSATTATALSPGTTWIVARASTGVSDSASITVASNAASSPGSDGGYVQIRWVGDVPSAPVAAAFEAARVRINGLFRSFGSVPATRIDLAAGTCMTGAPALGESVPGLVIFAQVTAIDGVGNVLGSSGPCIVRSGTSLPAVAAMQFDVADMAAMVANGSLNGVVLHEMMHSLGFGTIWGPDAQGEVAAPDGADPRYTGTTGQAEYAALGAADAPSGAPVENTGGPGTQGSHWRESVFHTELMTGWADGTMPMSRVTIGALKDFGYDVDLTKADPFVLSTSPVQADLRASQRIVEQTNGPIGVVDQGGHISPYKGPVAH